MERDERMTYCSDKSHAPSTYQFLSGPGAERLSQSRSLHPVFQCVRRSRLGKRFIHLAMDGKQWKQMKADPFASSLGSNEIFIVVSEAIL